ncbi:MAG TPA: hypothetical protein ENJ09_15730 [Planctomycetes bacterium]|nr:hypothetical protein [Planctomycetota bacterium]
MLLSLLLLFLVAPTAQDSAAQPETRTALEAASPAAREAWARFVHAARPDGGTEPIQSFRLHAEGLRRDGVQTNETKFDYSYLAPDCIRFALPDGNETGRRGRRQRDYWKLAKNGVTRLVGRDFAQDRRLVEQMHTLARNFTSLASPNALRIQSLSLLDAPPPELWPKLRRQTRRLTWISITSPDFALFLRDAAEERGHPLYRVDIALGDQEPDRDLPRYAVIRELPSEGRPPAPPLLVALKDYIESDSIPFPTTILAYALEESDVGAVFSELPIQEVYILEASLSPDLTVADFDPELEAEGH